MNLAGMCFDSLEFLLANNMQMQKNTGAIGTPRLLFALFTPIMSGDKAVLAGLELYGPEYVKLRFDANFLEFTATIEHRGKALSDQKSLPRPVYVEKNAQE